jgi:hypothetical protein
MKKGIIIGGLAFLLGFLSNTNGEELNIWNYAFTTNNIHSRHVYNSYDTNSLENLDANDDILDYPYTNGQWLGGYTINGISKLRRDSRPQESERTFTNYLTAFDQIGSGISCSNRLFFSIDKDNSNRTFTARVKYSDEQRFIDIRELIANHKGYFYLRDIVNATNNQVYCILEVSPRFIANPTISKVQHNSTNISIDANLQPGTYSQAQSTTNFQDWTNTNSETYAEVNSNNFNGSPADRSYENKSSITNIQAKSQNEYFRLRTTIK